MADQRIEKVKKIAILKGGALGDFIVTLPALKAIGSTYPEAEIVLLGLPWHKKFLVKNRTSIDRVIEVPLIKGIREERNEEENPNAIETFSEKVRQENFDIAISFQGRGIAANPFIKKINARITAGIVSEYAEPLDRSIDFYYYQNEVIRYVEVAKLIGAETTELEPEINVLQEDEEEITDLMRLNEKKIVVLHSCAVDIRRMWPLENYAPLADALKQKDIEVVFTGSADDKRVIDHIIDSMRYSAINTCGKISLGGLAALLSKALLVIGTDTGPLHLARAVKTPTVSIHWAPNLMNWGPLTRNIHRPVVSWNMRCPYCGIIPNDPYPFQPQGECDHAVSFVRDISVRQVLEAAESLLHISHKEVTEKNYASRTDE